MTNTGWYAIKKSNQTNQTKLINYDRGFSYAYDEIAFSRWDTTADVCELVF